MVVWVRMKTTVEISDSLFAAAKSLCKEQGLSFRQVIEEGLRALTQRKRPLRAPFRLRDGSFRGKGLRKDVSWPEMRGMIYKGRGE
jgi:hypothetical protein